MTTDDQAAQPQDLAVAAFTRLEGEIALMRRAVENLATEKADIDIPDYSDTLGEMAESLAAVSDTLDTIAAKPAMAMTPEGMAQRMDQAARSARQSDREQIAAAETRYNHAMRDLTKVVASAWSASYQREYLRWAACGGVLAGCLFWAIVPGILARQLPESWHMPEKIAMRVLREPSVWEAGVRLLRVGSPEAWRALSNAAEMRHQNKKAIADCERAAKQSKKAVRCYIKIEPPLKGSVYPSCRPQI
ncbi:hypothetical protein GGC65_000431 [Sphingopyxis sp. OAS728]|uniref:DUF6118 family protein n=1 Tax=Sphingopyxis sp. OAS728 TaxID=2663823 RepID=UPI001789B560|nr:DUF6118 family protein [Sphingopyxis sp. OAS728]MBE1525975.1 hypothetical protein [Sphingopyxis sp. OAS728]